MSITVVKDKGVTVVTVASDRKSVLPPLCQILRSLCYSPVCCSVYKELMQPDVVSSLGVRETELYLFICSVKLNGGLKVSSCSSVRHLFFFKIFYRLYRSWWVCSTLDLEQDIHPSIMMILFIWEHLTGWVVW